jgi:hypothetical protein
MNNRLKALADLLVNPSVNSNRLSGLALISTKVHSAEESSLTLDSPRHNMCDFLTLNTGSLGSWEEKLLANSLEKLI